MSPDAAGSEGTETTAGTDAEAVDTGGGDGGAGDDAATPADDGLADPVDLASGGQVEDGVGNLVAVYGVAAWPETFDALGGAARVAYPFMAGIDPAIVADHRLFVIDVGMCAAGITAAAEGTVDFYLHAGPDEPLAGADALNRAVFGTEPLVSPGFALPDPAECSRGWLPAYWDRNDPPGTVRYVLTNAASAGDEPERHVYQWRIDEAGLDDRGTAAGTGPELFGVGQTVTFNAGPLQDTAITVDGWTELIDDEAPLGGTRIVGVLLEVCAAGPAWPTLGLAVDGWNLAAPIDPGDHLARGDDGPGGCVEGWIEFAVPFGATPTGFTAGDGTDSPAGFAEWSLDGAALPTPR